MSTYESFGADAVSGIVTGVTGLVQAGVSVYNNIKTLEAQLAASKEETKRLQIIAQIKAMELELIRLTGKDVAQTDAEMGKTAKNVALVGGAAALGLMALSQI
jgi:hypothetical protein